jgi:putative membrane protein (TIGR04086 family)
MALKPRGKLKVFTENMSANYGMAWDVAIGTGGALIAALVFVALFAVGIKATGISENSIPVVNEVAKVLCILFGSWLSVRRHASKGWMRGGLTGLLYIVLAFVIFSAIDGDWSIGWGFASDLAMGAVVGGIGGIIFVNLRKKK